MSQLWALVAPDGSYVLRFTDSADHHPADHGHADECESLAVWPIEREPRAALGEGVDPATGAFDFDLGRVSAGIIAAIKAEAGRRIEAIAPLWRQINDMNDPTTPGATARAAAIASIRAWSNATEADLLAATSADEVRAVIMGLTE